MASTIVYVELTFLIQKEGDVFVGECQELGTSTCGETVEETLENLKDAVLVHMNELERTSQRGKVFKERKIEAHTSRPTRKTVRLDVPRSALASREDFPLTVSTRS